jgi:hypothetical protein
VKRFFVPFESVGKFCQQKTCGFAKSSIANMTDLMQNVEILIECFQNQIYEA